MDGQVFGFDGVISRWTVMLTRHGPDLTKAAIVWLHDCKFPPPLCHAMEFTHGQEWHLHQPTGWMGHCLLLQPFVALMATVCPYLRVRKTQGNQNATGFNGVLEISNNADFFGWSVMYILSSCGALSKCKSKFPAVCCATVLSRAKYLAVIMRISWLVSAHHLSKQAIRLKA